MSICFMKNVWKAENTSVLTVDCYESEHFWTYADNLTVSTHKTDSDFTMLTQSEKYISAMLDLEKRL